MGDGESLKSCDMYGNELHTLQTNIEPASSSPVQWSPVIALREDWESETPKNCPGTAKNQCQEVWDSQLLKIFSHL